jgi:hypothetical protein
MRGALASVAGGALLGACSVEKVDEAHVGVGYTDGFIEGQKWDGVVQPGGSRTVVNDHVYRLPARQITYITGDTAQGADGPSLVITTEDRQQMVIDLTIRGFLNTREGPLKPFFLEICQKERRNPDTESLVKGCWENADDQGDIGWDLMLRETFGNPLLALAEDIGLGYTSESLRYENEVKDEFATEFAERFRSEQNRLVGADEPYFCGPRYDRNEDNLEADKFCPNLSVEISRIRYASGDLEAIPGQRELAQQQAALAVEQEAAAIAQQRVNAARATSEYVELTQAEAMKQCAANPSGCSLTIIVGDSGDIGVTANPGG